MKTRKLKKSAKGMVKTPLFSEKLSNYELQRLKGGEDPPPPPPPPIVSPRGG